MNLFVADVVGPPVWRFDPNQRRSILHGQTVIACDHTNTKSNTTVSLKLGVTKCSRRERLSGCVDMDVLSKVSRSSPLVQSAYYGLMALITSHQSCCSICLTILLPISFPVGLGSRWILLRPLIEMHTPWTLCPALYHWRPTRKICPSRRSHD